MSLRIFDRPKSRDSRPGSPILPTKNQSPICSTGSVGFPKRYTRMGVLALIAFSAFLFFYGFEKTETIINNMRHPPLYERYHEYEDNLPQHNPDLPYPEGRDAKFFWASNHVTRTHLTPHWSKFNLTSSRFWLGKCHAGASCECTSSICDKAVVSRRLECQLSPC
jgi:hypothetical protein